MNVKVFLCLLMFLSIPSAFARPEFRFEPFQATDFRNINDLSASCAAPAASSFWCDRLDANLTLVTTKSMDIIFGEAGEIVALFAKQQRGQNFNGNYNLSNNQNLIPQGASIPGGSVLLDGDYALPENIEASWERSSDSEITGEFRYTRNGLEVNKTIIVSDIRNTLEVSLDVQRLAPGDIGAIDPEDAEAVDTEALDAEALDAEDSLAEDSAEDTEAADSEAPPSGQEASGVLEPIQVQYAFSGISNQESPTIKIGQGDSFSLNPISQAVSNPSYISLQSNNRNTGFAIIMIPNNDPELAAISLAPRPIIAMVQTLPTEEDASISMAISSYLGANELVRFFQEEYLDLPGLFNPNILGRLSLGILMLLQGIYGVVGNWGLSIILLTLLFRLMIWPLINTQTKSMIGMQKIQPKLQALQKKYKDNKEKLTQETMKLYKEEGVNPAGGCLPILVQMPLFIILWRVFVNFEFNQGFLWVPDLGLADPTYLLPILYVGVMIGQSFLMSKGNPQSLRQQLMINVVFVFFIISFPAGVTLYWVVSMMVQISQHYLIQRNAATAKPAASTS